jgi:hypothetical protein
MESVERRVVIRGSSVEVSGFRSCVNWVRR